MMLKKMFSDRNTKEADNAVHAVENRIQDAILTVMDKIIVPSIELAGE